MQHTSLQKIRNADKKHCDPSQNSALENFHIYKCTKRIVMAQPSYAIPARLGHQGSYSKHTPLKNVRTYLLQSNPSSRTLKKNRNVSQNKVTTNHCCLLHKAKNKFSRISLQQKWFFFHEISHYGQIYAVKHGTFLYWRDWVYCSSIAGWWDSSKAIFYLFYFSPR